MEEQLTVGHSITEVTMSTKPIRPRRRSSVLAIVLALTALTSLVAGASPSFADTGSVYVDGSFNVGAGHDFFNGAMTGFGNVGLEYSVMPSLTTGTNNTATGDGTLGSNTSGDSNSATGSRAGQSLTSGSDNVDIANAGVAGESGRIRIGTAAKQTAALIAGIYNTTIAGPTQAVVVNSNGRLGTAPAPASPVAKAKSASS